MYLAIFITKIINFLIKKLHLGAGYTWPGHLALKINPNIFSDNKIIPSKLVFISGTNGKTTTAKLISHILRKASFSVVTNKSGANLLNGIITELVLDTTFFGKSRSEIGVFEVDELVLPLLLERLRPDILVLTNLSRDQLDRYGEVDVIFDLWLKSFKELRGASLIYDSSQEIFNPIKKLEKVIAIPYKEELSLVKKLDLSGSHNSKNVKAALLVCEKFGVSASRALESLETFKPAYGRGEKVVYKTTSFRILLAKNPASFNNNLDLVIKENSKETHILFVLNDNIPDGRDISWIYDIDREKLKKVCEGRNVHISGKRAFDMAVRLKYSGVVIRKENVTTNLKKALNRLENKDKVLVFPNYSSMLEVRKILTGKSIL